MIDDVYLNTPFFQELKPIQRELLRPLLTPCECYPGAVLFEQGDRAKDIFLVVSGEIKIYYKPDDGPALQVARVRSGGIVGWSAALGNRNYTSGAKCSTYSQMLRVDGKALRDLCKQHPETRKLILDSLANVIAERLSSSYNEIMALLELSFENESKIPER